MCYSGASVSVLFNPIEVGNVAKREESSVVTTAETLDFDSLVSSIVDVNRQTQKIAVKAVNAALSIRNWLIGYHILEFEQKGSNRAAYGERLVEILSRRLSEHGMQRVTPRELRRFRQFYNAYPNIWESATPESMLRSGFGELAAMMMRTTGHIRDFEHTRSGSSTKSAPDLCVPHPELLLCVSFTHLAEIIQLPDESQRRFYEFECMRGNWSVRELRRQIASLLYERSGLSRDKAKLSQRVRASAEQLNAEQIVRDPYVFEFLGLRPREAMGETDLEGALLDRLQDFLLEMGHGFCLEAKQKRILIGDEYFFVDMVFYHRILKCHVLVELKADAFRHEHLGQLNTYVAYYKRHEMTKGDKSPIGILLCTQKNEALVEFALGDISNQLFVSRYALEIPDRADMESFLKQLATELGRD